MKLIILLLVIFVVMYNFQQLENNTDIKEIILDSAKKNNLDLENTFNENKDEYEEQQEKINEVRNIFNDINSSKKIILDDIIENWSLNKDTIDFKIESTLITIIKNILFAVKNITENDYFVKNIENVYIMKDKNNNYRSVLNCFIYNIKEYHTVKLVIDFVSIDNIIYLNYIDIDESGVKTMINNYDLKWNSGGILLNINTFNSDVINNIDRYYRDKYFVELYKKENYKYDFVLDGGYTLNQLITNYVPAESKTIHSPLFCDKTTYDWNNLSLFNKSNEHCDFNKQTVATYPNYPTFMPGDITNNVDDSMYEWLNNPENTLGF